MPTFPAELYGLMPVDGFRQGGPIGATISTQMDFGDPKVRRRTTASPTMVSMRLFPLTLVQLAAFKAFYKVDLMSGALRFDMVNPLTGESLQYRFAKSDGDPYAVRGDRRRPGIVSVEFDLLELP